MKQANKRTKNKTKRHHNKYKTNIGGIKTIVGTSIGQIISHFATDFDKGIKRIFSVYETNLPKEKQTNDEDEESETTEMINSRIGVAATLGKQ
jgi:hypothetical protein